MRQGNGLGVEARAVRLDGGGKRVGILSGTDLEGNAFALDSLEAFRPVAADFDETIDRMLDSARRFDAGKIRSDQVARTERPLGEE